MGLSGSKAHIQVGETAVGMGPGTGTLGTMGQD